MKVVCESVFNAITGSSWSKDGLNNKLHLPQYSQIAMQGPRVGR